jgi:cell division protein FtsL
MSTRLLLVVLVLANVISAVGVVHARHGHRQQFFALTGLEKVRDELNIEFSRLQLEQATLAESNRIDKIARGRLNMKTPDPAEIVVVQP